MDTKIFSHHGLTFNCTLVAGAHNRSYWQAASTDGVITICSPQWQTLVEEMKACKSTERRDAIAVMNPLPPMSAESGF